MSFTRRQWYLLAYFLTVNILCGTIYTLQQPFYPIEAESKNATAFEYSVVFGIYEGTVIFAAPIMSSLVHYTGVKNAFFVGLVGQALTTISFGFLELLNSLPLFLGLSILIRILEGFGYGATFVGMYTLIPVEFPDHIGLTMGLLEMGNAVGFTIGPPIGGQLYLLGGFLLPFLSTGIAMLIFGLTLPIVLWNTASPPKPKHQESIFKFILDPAIFINFFVLFGAQFVLGFNYAIWSPFFQHTFNSTAGTVGLIFGLSGLLYALPVPFFSWITRKTDPTSILFTGLCLDLVGNMMIGPLPIFGLEPNFIRTVLGVCFFAIGTEAALIGGFVNASVEASRNSERDKTVTMSLVSGWYMCVFSIGTASGAPIAGALYQEFGFENAEYCPVLMLSLAIFLEVYYIWNFKWKRILREKTDGTYSETDKLLQ